MKKIKGFCLRKIVKKPIVSEVGKELKFQVGELRSRVLLAAARMWNDMSDEDVVEKLMDIGGVGIGEDADETMYMEHFLGAAFIQSCIEIRSLNQKDIIAALCLGNWLIGLVDGYPNLERGPNICPNCVIKDYLSKDGARKAAIRYADDDKQKEKSFIFERWKEWQIMPKQYKGQAGFARSMIDKCEHLTSTKIVEDWCRAWKIKAKSLTLPA